MREQLLNGYGFSQGDNNALELESSATQYIYIYIC